MKKGSEISKKSKPKKEQIPIYIEKVTLKKIDSIVENSEGVYRSRSHFIELALINFLKSKGVGSMYMLRKKSQPPHEKEVKKC